ncbi:hypothetical protein [Aureimonas populi]|uniref:Uncharacterized protein n=1 Tax=Aureimonas populi TaxID=1701758 RepID=A0ABW5CJR8_9HYPH|nr:hypothetical protein [Aureimonas populi]
MTPPYRIEYNWRDAVAVGVFFAFSIPWTAMRAWVKGDGTFLAMTMILIALAVRIIWLYVYRPR